MSEPRVYLFADFGKGPVTRPRCAADGPTPKPGAHSHQWIPAHPTWPTHWCCAVCGFAILAETAKNSGNLVAREWWLVECESAEAGRAIIAASQSEGKFHVTADRHARILASGGAA